MNFFFSKIYSPILAADAMNGAVLPVDHSNFKLPSKYLDNQLDKRNDDIEQCYKCIEILQSQMEECKQQISQITHRLVNIKQT